MTRTTTLVAWVLLVGLTTSLAPTAGAAAPARAAAAPVVRTFVAYGDKAVEVPRDQRAVIRFHGHRGDIVSLSGVAERRMRLFHAGRNVPQTWEGGGLHRLPTTGTFAFRVNPDRFGDRRVGLVKARLHDLEVDGRAVRTPRVRRGYLDLAVVRLAEGDRVTVDSGRDEQRVYPTHGRFCLGYGGPLLLRPGHDVRVNNDTSAICDEAVPGRTLVRVRSGYRVTAASAIEVAVLPDGAPVTLSARHQAARELVFTFNGTADELVYFDELQGPGITNSRSTLNRWAAPVLSLLTLRDGESQSFVLWSTGATELSTVTAAVGGGATATVRLRKGIRVPDLATDGPAVDVTFDGSGTRLYALATGTGQRLESTTRDLGSDEGWTVEMGPRAPWACGQEPGGPMGCADNGFLSLSSASTATAASLDLRNPVAVAFPAPGAVGTVSLRLLTQTTP